MILKTFHLSRRGFFSSSTSSRAPGQVQLPSLNLPDLKMTSLNENLHQHVYWCQMQFITQSTVSFVFPAKSEKDFPGALVILGILFKHFFVRFFMLLVRTLTFTHKLFVTLDVDYFKFHRWDVKCVLFPGFESDLSAMQISSVNHIICLGKLQMSV